MHASERERASGWARAVRHWPVWLGSVVLVTSVAASARAIVALTGGRFVYALDDAYIHMAMARNLAQYGVWGCTPFRFASASSSPLCTTTLAAAYVLTGAHGSCAGSAMPAMALLGMEHVLHLLLTITFAAAVTRVLSDTAPADARRPADTAVLCVLAALLAASRYEGLFLVALACLACAVLGRWRTGALIGICAAAPLALLGLVSVGHGAYVLPNSLMIKTGREGASIWTLLRHPIDPADVAFLRRDHPLVWVIGAGAVAAVVEAVRARSLRGPRGLVPLGLVLMTALHVHFAPSSAFWVYRYDAYLIGFGVFAAAVVLSGVSARIPTPWPTASGRLAVVGVMAWTATLGDIREGLYPGVEIAAASLTYREHYQAARFVHDRRPGETVIVNDVGAMAFQSNGDVLDLFGLCNLEPVMLRLAGPYDKIDVEAWTLPYRPSLAIVQLSWGWVVGRIPDDWLKVAEVEVLPEGRRLGFFTPSHARADAERLREDVERFYRPLEGPLGYHVRLF